MEPEGSLPPSQMPPLAPIISQLEPFHTPTTHFLKVHLNIILPSMPGSLVQILTATQMYKCIKMEGIMSVAWNELPTSEFKQNTSFIKTFTDLSHIC